MAVIVAPVQAFLGDGHGLNTLEHQPAKIAAIEGHWGNRPGEATPLNSVWHSGYGAGTYQVCSRSAVSRQPDPNT
nr:cytochrome ubiquinol oxidase subunit I [Pseudescherichia vulneris]